jgi:hypothetical protein
MFSLLLSFRLVLSLLLSWSWPSHWLLGRCWTLGLQILGFRHVAKKKIFSIIKTMNDFKKSQLTIDRIVQTPFLDFPS